MITASSTSSNTKLQRKLDAFAQHLCARRGLADCTIQGDIGAIRRLYPTIGLNPPHHILDSLIVKMRKAGASYRHVVNTSLALERYTEFIGNPIQLGRPKIPKRIIRGTLAACRNIREQAILTFSPTPGCAIRNCAASNSPTSMSPRRSFMSMAARDRRTATHSFPRPAPVWCSNTFSASRPAPNPTISASSCMS